MAYIVVALFAVLTVLAVVAAVVHVRVLLQARPGARPLLKKALVRHNWELAATLVEPAGETDLARLRRLVVLMFQAAGAAFVLVAIVALFGGVVPTR